MRASFFQFCCAVFGAFKVLKGLSDFLKPLQHIPGRRTVFAGQAVNQVQPGGYVLDPLFVHIQLVQHVPGGDACVLGFVIQVFYLFR